MRPTVVLETEDRPEFNRDPSPDRGITSKRQSDQEAITLSQIDRSLKTPILFFVTAALIWLMIGTLFALIASSKMHIPTMMQHAEWSTFGRIRSAHLNAVAFGWVNNAIFALSIWIMARLCRSPIRHGGLMLVAGIFWNVGVGIGVIGILAGHLTSVEWLEMPPYVAPLLTVAYALIAIWGVLAFRFRRTDHVYVSQWYILAALFWFPWIYTIAQMMIFVYPVQGILQAVVNWWFGHNVLGLWMTPMGLAISYYLIPKILGKPIHSYYLSVVGFWSLALFYNWAGMHHLIGGPIPVWMASAGIVGSMMMFIPVIVSAINHHMTAAGSFRHIWNSPSLRFVVFGAMSYTAASAIGSLMALREVNVITHFTHFTVGHAHHGVYAFVTMTLFGGIYFMLPRITGTEWPSLLLTRVHFWCCAVGITVMVISLSIGGFLQGLQMNNAEIPFIDTVVHTLPYLKWRTFSGILLGIGHTAFFVHTAWMLVASTQQVPSGPHLMDAVPAEV